MNKPTKLGQVIIALFPNFVDRMNKLSEMRTEANKLLIKYRFMEGRMQDQVLYKFMSKYYTLTHKYHAEKYWFMGDLPTLGPKNTVL